MGNVECLPKLSDFIGDKEISSEGEPDTTIDDPKTKKNKTHKKNVNKKTKNSYSNTNSPKKKIKTEEKNIKNSPKANTISPKNQQPSNTVTQEMDIVLTSDLNANTWKLFEQNPSLMSDIISMGSMTSDTHTDISTNSNIAIQIISNGSTKPPSTATVELSESDSASSQETQDHFQANDCENEHKTVSLPAIPNKIRSLSVEEMDIKAAVMAKEMELKIGNSKISSETNMNNILFQNTPVYNHFNFQQQNYKMLQFQLPNCQEYKEQSCIGMGGRTKEEQKAYMEKWNKNRKSLLRLRSSQKWNCEELKNRHLDMKQQMDFLTERSNEKMEGNRAVDL